MIAVIGAGMLGACTAWELTRRGEEVVLLDAGDVSGATTGLGEGNVLCSDKDVGPELELALHGLAVYDELDEHLGALAQIRRKGALIVHPELTTWAGEPARIARLRAAGVRAELLDAVAVPDAEPELTGPLHGASYFPRDLQCAPRAIARALAREVADVRPHTRVEAIDTTAGRVTGVTLADGAGALGADAVVLAAGPWSAALAATAGLHLPVEPRWGQLLQLTVPAGSPRRIRHKVVDGSYLASVADADPGLQVSTVLETTWDGDVIVGSSRARRGFDGTVDPAVSEAMLERAARLMPGLRGLRAARAWSGLRPWLPDHLPAIGPSRIVEGLWCATGHEGAGVALGPITGRLVAQALGGEPTTMGLAPFDPDRFAAAAAR